MRLIRILPLLPALLGLCLHAAQPRASEALYQVSLPVSDQSAQERQRAAREGLARALVRLSGRSDLSTYPGSQPFLARAERYLSQFHYEPLPEGGAFNLHLRFDPAVMETVLQESGLPVWPLNRPAVRIWGLVQDNGRSIPLSTRLGEWQAALEQAAQDRGLSLLWPSAAEQPGAALLRQRNESALRQHLDQPASSDVAIAGEWLQTGSRWHGQWLLLHNGPAQTLNAEADSPVLAAAVLIGLVADVLAEQHSVSTQPGMTAHSLLLQLDGVQTFDDYRRSQTLLRSLASVRSVQPERVQGDRIDYRLHLNSEPAALHNELRLHAAFSASPGNSNDSPQYRWNSDAAVP